MQTNKSTDGTDVTTRLTRRRLLAVTSAVATAGLAGCEETEFVDSGGGARLQTEALEEFELAETRRETHPNESSDGATDTEEPPTREYVGYGRGSARGQPTAVEAFAGTVNETNGAGPTAVVTASDAGVEELTVPAEVFEPTGSSGTSTETVNESTKETTEETTRSIDEPVTIDGGNVSLVVPAGARQDGDVDPARVLALVPARAIAEAAGTSMWPLYWSEQRLLPAREFAPDDDWLTTKDYDGETPMERWTPDDLNEYVPGPIEQVLVASNDRSLAEVFGRGGDELGGRPVEGDDDVDPGEVVVAVPGDQFLPGAPIHPWDETPVTFRPAPLGGVTFGLGTFVLPPDSDGEIGWTTGGRAPIEEELQSEAGRKAVSEFVLGGSVLWHDAPTADGGSVFRPPAPTEIEPITRITYDLGDDLSGEGELRTLFAAVDTDIGREVVAVHAGWIPPLEAGDGDVNEYVLVVGGQRAPVGENPEESGSWVDDEDLVSEWSDWIESGSNLTAAAVKRLDLE